MEPKKIISRTLIRKIALEDDEYFKYIYKKTEKIACAVFYIIRTSELYDRSDNVVKDVESSATKVRDLALQSLQHDMGQLSPVVSNVRFALINLESSLRIAVSALIVSRSYMDVFVHEIDSVQRSLRRYANPPTTDLLDDDVLLTYSGMTLRTKPVSQGSIRRQLDNVRDKEDVVTPAYRIPRPEKIIDIIKDKGEATIKDIVSVIADCSEKTIQRDLVSLIKDNKIVREGERRWSKYRLV